MDTTSKRQTIPTHLLRALAVDSQADPRTVRSLLLGGRVMPMTRARILDAIEKRGLGHLLAADGEAPR